MVAMKHLLVLDRSEQEMCWAMSAVGFLCSLSTDWWNYFFLSDQIPYSDLGHVGLSALGSTKVW
jgi:hypothetical protein